MARYRTHLLVLLVFAMVGLIWRWWVPPPMPDHEPLPGLTIDQSDPSVRAPSPRPRPPPRPVPEAVLKTSAARIADARGLGWIRCAVPLADGPVSGFAFEHAQVTDGILVAEVSKPSGRITVHRPLDPTVPRRPDDAMRDFLQASRNHVLTLSWTGASDGRQGACEVTEPAPITIRGTVEPGGPDGHLFVHGCGPPAIPDDEGVFELQWMADIPCTAVAVISEGTWRGEGPPTFVDSPSDLDIVVQPPVELDSPRDYWERYVDQETLRLETLESLSQTLESLLDAEDLDPETRKNLTARLEDNDRTMEVIERTLERDPPPAEESKELDWEPVIVEDVPSNPHAVGLGG